MKRLVISGFCAIAVAVTAIVATLSYPLGVQPTLAQDAEAMTRSISMAGFGQASAAPDFVDLQLVVGSDSMNFGPNGPQFQPFDEENLELVKLALVELGIEEENIQMNPFGQSDFGPGGNVGKASFTYDDPQKLNEFLNSLIEALDEQRGPNIQGARAIFRIDDCMAIESEAMKAAVENAQSRAEEMASVIDGEIGQLVSIREQSATANSGPMGSSSSTCTTLENAVHQMGFNPFSTSSLTENTPAAVEVSVAIEATFELN